MTSNETEAVKLARDIVAMSEKPLERTGLWWNQALILARAILATPQTEPQDEERARRWLSGDQVPVDCAPINPGRVKSLAAQFAAVRAQERAKGWPGTVPSCPACASTSDVEWATCETPDNVCPLKRAKIIPPQEM